MNIIKKTLFGLLAFFALTTSHAKAKLDKVGTITMTSVERITFIGLTGAAATGGFDGFVTAGGTASATYASKDVGHVTGDFAGDVKLTVWQARYYADNVGTENAVFMADCVMTIRWRDADGYEYNANLTGPAKLDAEAINKYLSTGEIVGKDYYETFSGTLMTNNPSQQSSHFKTVVFDAVKETVMPDGKLNITADLYLLDD